MYKITANVPVTGVGYGLRFVEGVAETPDAALAEKLKRKGYKVEQTGEGARLPAALPGNAPPVPPPPKAAGEGEAENAQNPEKSEGAPDAETAAKIKKMGRAELDAYAKESLGMDTTVAPNKDAALELVLAELNK
jgi:hypothetical protein